MDLAGRSAIVTGGAGGLGKVTVRLLVEAGMGVVVFDRDGERGAALAAELGDGAVDVAGDVNDDDDVAAAIDATGALGPLSLLVNVAGGALRGGRIVGSDGTPHDKAAFVACLELNTIGTFNVSRLVAAAMAGNTPDEHGQRGVIVNTSSISGFEGQPGQLAYGAAKAAILGMTLPMARDLAPLGIRVGAIAPGPMGTEVMLRVKDRLEVDPTAGAVFPKRMGRPAEFARLVLSIARNPYLNGVNIRLDGAMRLDPG